ncbi:MAG: hypothetical protein SWH54_14400 [Thermodesulfobacteriota bacterium]|nr:hypothetical protein [Thermodesulfobacteriota bacterium]
MRHNKANINLSLTLKKKLIVIFYQLLSQGFIIYSRTGCSVKELLCGQLGIRDEYLAERIQTIFLDYKTVDDVDAAIIQPGSTLALSAAMPGVLGATLRKGGWYAPMRRQISHDKAIASDKKEKGEVTIKLFNLIVRELGPLFLQQGISVKGEDFFDIVARNESVFMAGCKTAIKDDHEIGPEKLMENDWQGKQVLLQITL